VISDQTIGIIIGGVLVTLSGIAVAFVRGLQESRLDKQKRSDDRQSGRDAFQRENLLQLQERLGRPNRCEINRGQRARMVSRRWMRWASTASKSMAPL
jgi:hypothetical protein